MHPGADPRLADWWPVGLRLDDLLERPPIPVGLDVARERLAGRRVLVTGAGGSIGTALSHLLVELGPAELTLLDHHENSLFALRQELLAPSVHFALADVRDRTRLGHIFRRHRPEVVFHLAAYKHVHLAEIDPDQTALVNVLGSLNIFDAAMEIGCARVVYPSTDKAVLPPSVYGATKRFAELLVMALAREIDPSAFVVARLVNTLGAQGGVIRTFAQQIRQGQPVSVTDVRMTRYWITMEEAVCFLAQAGGLAVEAPILLLALGEPIRLVDVGERLWHLIRPDEPFRLREVGARPGERLDEQLLYDHERPASSRASGILAVHQTLAPPSLVDLRTAAVDIADAAHRAALDEVRRILFEAITAAVRTPV
ncbi:MAG: SDR family NAD(P)-dependent oxidoreductase [Chloroflexi bacterium]|nr:SDR family NAD(P)-dependent oxidoreductase [Chloroflexota bacterium]